MSDDRSFVPLIILGSGLGFFAALYILARLPFLSMRRAGREGTSALPHTQIEDGVHIRTNTTILYETYLGPPPPYSPSFLPGSTQNVPFTRQTTCRASHSPDPVVEDDGSIVAIRSLWPPEWEEEVIGDTRFRVQ